MYQSVQFKIVLFFSLTRISVNGSSGERVSSPRITAIKAASAMSSLNIQSGPCSPSSNPGTSMVTAAGGPPPGGSLINGVNLSTSSLPGTSTASQGSPSQVGDFYQYIPDVRNGFQIDRGGNSKSDIFFVVLNTQVSFNNSKTRASQLAKRI